MIRAIEYQFPVRTVTNEELASEFPDWSSEKIFSKTGISARRIAGESECASDLAEAAARKLLDRQLCPLQELDFLLVCTQSPDYLLPTTACLLQERLGLPREIAALDINLGCSGFVYGLSIAKSLVASGEARNVLLLTCDTYSKYMDPKDLSVRVLFGDAAAATLIQGTTDPPTQGGEWIGPSLYGTDGSGASKLILRRGGTRTSSLPTGTAGTSDPLSLCMNGPEIFAFTLNEVPRSVKGLLDKANAKQEDIDQFVFHQANKFMLEHLRKKLDIPIERFVYSLEDCGNTTSSSIPIALRRAAEQGQIEPGNLLMLVGFGVGYSWGATMVRWQSC